MTENPVFRQRSFTDERCKNIPIRCCCNDLADVIMMNDIRESILYLKEESEDNRFMLWWADGDCTPLRYCPSCDTRIEFLTKGGSQ